MEIYFTDSDPKYVVNRSCESWQVSFLISGKNFDISSLRIKFYFSEKTFMRLRTFSLLASLLKIFIKKGRGKEEG